jgi:glycopeptide antibiotics resistance protein
VIPPPVIPATWAGTGPRTGSVLSGVHQGEAGVGTVVEEWSATADDADDPTGQQPPVHQRARGLGLLLIAAHLALVVWLAFRPISAAWMADANLTPFATIRSELHAGTAHAYLELARGLLLLAPLGVLLPLAGGRVDAPALPSFLRTLLTGLLIATGVELFQSSLTSHLLDVDDILLAGAGMALAHLLVVPASRAALRRRRGRERSAAGRIRTGGFGIAPSAH